MPTGYTDAVATGEIKTLKEFAYRCARAMGACIDMRDKPMDAPIPERFEPSSFYKAKIDTLTQELETLRATSDEDLAEQAEAEYILALEKRQEYGDRVDAVSYTHLRAHET